MKTPLAVFAYNRPEHLGRALAALARCARLEECAVTIFCDGPRESAARSSVEAVREVARSWAADHDAEVREAAGNLGLAHSIVGGVSELCAAHGRVIVLEDDLEPAPDFLTYMLTALDRWSDESAVWQVAGFRLPFAWSGSNDALFLPCTTTWGWATWQRAWQHFRWTPPDLGQLDDPTVSRAFDLDGAYPYSQMLRDRLTGRNDSWGILWWWTVFRAAGLVLYPRESLLTVGGFDESGTHCGADGAIVAAQVRGKFPRSGARMPAAATTDADAFAALREYLRATTSAPRRAWPWWRRALSLHPAR